MFEQRPGLQKISRLIVSLAAIVILFTVLVSAYFDKRNDYFVSQNFRLLNEVGTQLTKHFELFEKNFFPQVLLEKVIQDLVEKMFVGTDCKEPDCSAQKRSQILKALKGEEGNSALAPIMTALKKALKAEGELNAARSAQDGAHNARDRARSARDRARIAETELSTAETELSTAETELCTAETELRTAETETNNAWTEVYEQIEALETAGGEKFFSREDVKKRYYSDLRNMVRLDELVHQLKKNPVYRRIDMNFVEGTECKNSEDKPSAEVGFSLDRTKAQTQLAVINCGPLRTIDLFLKATLPFEDLMPYTTADISTNFDLLLIADEDGKVLYSEDVSGNVFTNFVSLMPYLHNDGQEEHADNEGTEKKPTGVMSQTTLKDVEVAGTEYRLFLQPFRPPLKEIGQNGTQENGRNVWYVCGVSKKSEFNINVRAVSLTTTGLIILVLVLGLLSWPYLKIFFISANQKLSTTDVSFLVVSLVLGSALVTLLLLDTLVYRGVRDQLNDSAEQIAAGMQKRFREELAEAFKHLHESSRRIAQSNAKAIIKKWELNQYPPFENVFFVDQDGWLLADCQETYQSSPVGRFKLSERNYFRRAIGPRSQLWLHSSSEAKSPFFIERVHAYTTGLKLSVLSMPYRGQATGPGKGCSEPGKVAVIAKRFLSFQSAVLPPHFGFAVIEDKGGKVIFHSDDDRSLVERFFLETDQNRALQSAIKARHAHSFNGWYKGIDHHFYVEPILDVPWSLVVFYDRDLVQALSFEIGLTAATVLFCYTGLFVLGIIVIQLFFSDTHWSWLWPQWGRGKQYKHVAMLLMLVACYYALGIWLLEGVWLELLIISAPLFVMRFLYLVFKRKTEIRRWKRGAAYLAFTAGVLLSGLAIGNSFSWIWTLVCFSLLGVLVVCSWLILVLPTDTACSEMYGPTRGFRGSYRWVVFLSLLIIAVLPSVALFKDAFQVRAKKFTKFNQLEIARGFNNRNQAIQKEAIRLRPADYNTPEARQVQLKPSAQCRGVYNYDKEDVAVCHLMRMEDVGLSSQLHEQKFPHALRQEFQKHASALPDTVSVAVIGNNLWQIGEQEQGRQYRIEKEGGYLYVYLLREEYIIRREREHQYSYLSEAAEAFPEHCNGENNTDWDSFQTWLARRFPIFNDISGELHQAIYNKASDESWKWEECLASGQDNGDGRKNTIQFTMYDGHSRSRLRSDILIRSDILTMSMPRDFTDWAVILIGFLLFLIGVWILIGELASRIVGLDLPNFEVFGNGDRTDGQLLFSFQDSKFGDELGKEIDLPALQKEFKETGEILLSNSAFTVKESNSEWRVADKDKSNEKTFVIRHEQNNHNVYEEWIPKKYIGEWRDKNRILVRPPSIFIDELEKKISTEVGQHRFVNIDLSWPTQNILQHLEKMTIDHTERVFLVKNFEFGILDAQLRLALLWFLEDQVFHHKNTVLLCSHVSPLYRLVTPGAYPETEKKEKEAKPSTAEKKEKDTSASETGEETTAAGSSVDEAFRWSALFAAFRTERFPFAIKKRSDTTPPLEATLIRECGWAEELEPIYQDLLPIIDSEVKDKTGRLTEEQIVKQVGDRAGAFYRKLWMFCTKEERLVLLHLAQGHLLNTHNAYVIECLMRRGLIRRAPDFQLASESLARYVLTAEPRKRITEWEREGPESTWLTLRAPFLLVLLLIALFIAYTAGEALEAMGAIVPAALASLPVIVRALNFLRSGEIAKLTEE